MTMKSTLEPIRLIDIGPGYSRMSEISLGEGMTFDRQAGLIELNPFSSATLLSAAAEMHEVRMHGVGHG